MKSWGINMSNYFERLFNEENREKKKAGSGVFHRASRLRKHEVVRTPSENLTGYEKRKITAPGIVYTTTIEGVKLMEMLNRIANGEIPSREEISSLEFSSAQRAAAEIRRLHNNVEIVKEWKCTSQNVSNFFRKYQVAKAKNNVLVGQAAIEHWHRINESRGLTSNDSDKQNLSLQAMEIALNDVSNSSAPAAKLPIPMINICKTFNNTELRCLLERLAVFLSEPESKFYVELKVTEVN